MWLGLAMFAILFTKHPPISPGVSPAISPCSSVMALVHLTLGVVWSMLFLLYHVFHVRQAFAFSFPSHYLYFLLHNFAILKS